MRTYHIEFFYDSDRHSENKLLKALHESGVDIEATYTVDPLNRLAHIKTITGIGDDGSCDLLAACRVMYATQFIQEACESHFVGQCVKQMFSNYPELATSDAMTAEEKSEILKLK